MNKNIKGINVKAADIVKKYTENVIIRMSEFYTENVGGQEFCMVSKAVYAELIKNRELCETENGAAADSDSTDKVIIEVKDFFPYGSGSEEYIEIDRVEYYALMAFYMPFVEMYSECGTEYKVVVKTKDFYPFLCYERELTELDGSTYETLMSFKPAEEIYYDEDLEEEKTDEKIESEECENNNEIDEENDNDIPVEVYEELLKYKELENEYKGSAEGDTVRIRISDFYPNNCSDEEYCEVSREVYEELMKNKREDHAVRVKDSRYVMNYCFDEVQCGEEEGKYSECSDRDIQLAILLRELFVPISEKLFRRAVLYFINGYSVNTIAMLEGISARNARRSVQNMKKIVRNAGYDYFF